MASDKTILDEETARNLTAAIDKMVAKAEEFRKLRKSGRWVLELVWDDGFLKSSEFCPRESEHYTTKGGRS